MKRSSRVTALFAVIFALLVLLALRTATVTPFCRVHYAPEFGDKSEYWESPFITNGNGVTHICAHIYSIDGGRWGVEIPASGLTLGFLAFDRESADRLVRKYCSTGL